MTSPTPSRRPSVTQRTPWASARIGAFLLGLVGLAAVLPVPAAPPWEGWAAQTGAGWPTNWGVRNDRPVPVHYTLDPSVGGEELDRAFRALPVLGIRLDPDDLLGAEKGIYSHPMESGEAWERPARMSWFPAGAERPAVEAGCGIRIQGGWNRRPEESPKHSLRLVFRKRHGTARLEAPLFDGGPTAFETLVLRGGNNNSWLHWSGEERRRADYLRDEWMRRSYAALGRPSARGRFVHVSLNGLYWGVYNLVERPDEHFAAARLGGKPKDWDSRNADKVLSGDDLAWRRLMALAPAADDPAVWSEIRGLLDLPAFVDYLLLNLYGANGDWDAASNWYAARRRDPSGGFVFFVWDGERTLEGVADDRLGDDAPDSPSWLFQRLRRNAAFREAFGRRAAEVLGPGGALSPEEAGARYRRLADSLAPAIAAEAARWGSYRATVDPYKTGPFERHGVDAHWRPEVRRLLGEYFPARTRVLAARLREAGLMEAAPGTPSSGASGAK